jgi:hypothetical protein
MRNLYFFPLLLVSCNLMSTAISQQEKTTECTLMIESDEQLKFEPLVESLEFLGQQPKEIRNFAFCLSAGLMASLATVVIPITMVCESDPHSVSCAATAFGCSLVGGAGIILSIWGLCAAAVDRVVYYTVAKLIKEAYSSDLSKPTINKYLSNYKKRNKIDEHTIEDLAKKIRIATEMGYFIAVKEFIKDPIISRYAKYEDMKKINQILKNSKIGSYYKKFKYPQDTVDDLLNMSLAELEAEKTEILALMKNWKIAVKNYIQKAIEQDKKLQEGNENKS